jgi:hypothetical protein
LPDAFPSAAGGGDGGIFSTVGEGSALQLASRDKPMADASVALMSLSFMVSSRIAEISPLGEGGSLEPSQGVLC